MRNQIKLRRCPESYFSQEHTISKILIYRTKRPHILRSDWVCLAVPDHHETILRLRGSQRYFKLVKFFLTHLTHSGAL